MKKKFELPKGIYGILTSKFSNGRSNLEVAKLLIKGGVKIIQYREKSHEKSLRTIYNECMEIRELTKEHNVLFIINDFIDIAILCKADGVHIGQDDIPIKEVRKLLGKDMIIGLSTHNKEQALKAVADNADYIGVGPIFRTQTKENVCDPVGFDYLNYTIKNIDLPQVIIGGIKKHNLAKIIDKGAKSICMVTEIIGADDILGKIKGLNTIFGI